MTVAAAAAEERHVAPADLKSRIAKALLKPVTADFDGVTLSEATAKLEALLGFPIEVDRDALEAADANLDRHVTVYARNLPCGSLLELLLAPFGAVWTVGDEALKITAKADTETEPELELRFYPVVRPGPCVGRGRDGVADAR